MWEDGCTILTVDMDLPLEQVETVDGDLPSEQVETVDGDLPSEQVETLRDRQPRALACVKRLAEARPGL